MNWNKFKQYIRTQSQQQDDSTDVDVDAIWSAIEPEVDELNAKQSKRRFFFLIIATGMALAVVGWLFFYQNSESQNQTSAELLNINANNEYDGKINNESSSAQVVLSTEPSHSGSETPTQNQVSVLAESNIDVKTIANASAHITTPITQTNEMESAIKLSSANEMASARLNTQNPVSNFLPNTETEIIPSNNSEITTIPIASPKTASSEVPLNGEDTERSRSAELPLNAEATEQEGRAFNLSNKINALPSMPSELLNPAFLSIASNYLPKLFPAELVEQSNFGDGTCWGSHKKFRFFVGAYGGASFVQRTLDAKSNLTEPVSDWVNLRNSSETSLEAQHYGVRLGIQHFSGVRLSSGFERTQILERYDYVGEKVIDVELVEVDVMNFDLSGNVRVVSNMISKTTSESATKRIFNRYTLMDVPFLLGYHKSFGKWTAGIDAGTFVNISLDAKGTIPDKNQMDIDLQNSQTDYFKSKIGLSYSGRLSLSRTIGTGLEINCSPMFRYFPKDFSTTSNPIAQKYFMLGGYLGLNMVF